MNIKAKGTVTIPKLPRSLMALIPWAKSVNLAIQQLRDRTWTASRGGSGSAAAGDAVACSFGRIISISDETEYTKGLDGGLVVCGDKNFNVPYQGLNLGTDGEWLISIKVSTVKFNTDDDDEIFLPGVETATADPEWENTDASSEETNYPDNIPPASPTGTATIFVPLGRLTIEDGTASFAPTGCGPITINQCGGTVSFSRG